MSTKRNSMRGRTMFHGNQAGYGVGPALCRLRFLVKRLASVLACLWFATTFPARAEEAYEIQGVVSSTGFLPGTNPIRRVTRFQLLLAARDRRYFLTEDWLTHSNHTEIGFDGTNCYQLVLTPIEKPEGAEGDWEKLEHPVLRVGPLRDGLPYGAIDLSRLILLALATGKLLDNSNRVNLSVPWSELKDIESMREVGCFSEDAERFGDELGLPKRITWRFSAELWKKRYGREPVPDPLTNGMVVAWYSANAWTNHDGMSAPTEFSLTGLAKEGYVRQQFQGFVSNISKVVVTSFIPDISTYKDGCTVQDARFATRDLPNLVVAYNRTNMTYPSPDEPWLQALVQERRLALLDRLRRQKLRHIMRHTMLVVLAAALLIPFLSVVRRKQGKLGHAEN